MTLLQLLVMLIIAAVCGAIGQSIAGMTRGGCLTSIAVGFIGALLGTWIAQNLGLPEILVITVGDQPFPIVWAILGSALFVALIALMTGRRGPPGAK